MLEYKVTPAEKTIFTQRLIDDLYNRHMEIYGKCAQQDKALCIVKVINHIVENISDDITLEDLERCTGKTKYDICRFFNLFYRVTPIKWMWKVRLTLAREFISNAPEWSLTDICYACGFSSLPHFSRSFTKTYKQSPLKFKKHVMKYTWPGVKHDGSHYDFIFGQERSRFSRQILINNLNNVLN